MEIPRCADTGALRQAGGKHMAPVNASLSRRTTPEAASTAWSRRCSGSGDYVGPTRVILPVARGSD